MNAADKKITKALEYCLTVDVAGCSECPYRKGRNYINRLETDALALINRLDVELEAMRAAASSYKMHYDNLAREIFAEIEKVIGEKYNHYVFGNKELGAEEKDAIINCIDALSACFVELKRKHITPTCRECTYSTGCEEARDGVACDMFES